MDIRDQRPEVRTPDVVLVPGPRAPEPAPAPAAPRRWRGVRGGGVAAVALALLAVGVLLGRTVLGPDSAVVTSAPAASTALPGLQVQVSGPSAVAAGAVATFRIRWQDDAGQFSGTSEEWGDGVGVSSEQLAACDATAAVPQPGQGSVQVRHTWATPGEYQVRLGVHTSTCRDGAAVIETVERVLTVQVGAP